jgi:hypothetical protein
VLLHQETNGFRDRLLAVVGVADDPDPHGSPVTPRYRFGTRPILD